MAPKHVAAILALCLSAAGVAWADDGEAPGVSLGKSSYVYSASFPKPARDIVPQACSPQLSPDGRYLLYPTAVGDTPADENQAANQAGLQGVMRWLSEPVKIMLRDLETGKDRRLPVGTPPRSLALLGGLASPFGGDPNTLVLPKLLETKTPARGMPDPRSMALLLYDIPSGKVRRLPVRAAGALAILSPDGERLAVTVAKKADRMTELPEIRLGPVDGNEFNEAAVKGIVMGFGPAGKNMVVFQPPYTPAVPRHANKKRARLLLYNIETGKSTNLPVAVRGIPRGKGDFEWMAKGKYLAYPDVEKYMKNPGANQEEKRRIVTRIWDVSGGKPLTDLPQLIPVGPGPTEKSLLCRKNRGVLSGEGIWLYDHAARKITRVDRRNELLLDTNGSKIVYGIVDKNELKVYVADLKVEKVGK
ncbi:MAG: hypothetical protein ACLFV7_01080 [Phycisphaerae bacterium]